MRDFFDGHPFLKLILLVVVAILATMQALRGFRLGYVPQRFYPSRKSKPFRYWFTMILYCIFALALWMGAAATALKLFQEG